MGFRYWSGGHTKYRLMYHLVWIPKYRKRVLRGEIARTVTHLIYEAVKINWWWVEELKVMKNHVYTIIQIHPKESLAEVTVVHTVIHPRGVLPLTPRGINPIQDRDGSEQFGGRSPRCVRLILIDTVSFRSQQFYSPIFCPLCQP
ncbi:IS200/IS605 family transposase [Patescibacteria group bacterium]|nr:IS200/IS605 family transposase [Patescibacteria group bacterium]